MAPEPAGDLAFAHGQPLLGGRIKASCDDFAVVELLGFVPSGCGEHVFLKIEKQGQNTEQVARQLAKFAQLPRQTVSYAGMKDRVGRTTQWFSVHLPGKQDRDWKLLESDSLHIVEVTRNDRKLKKGALKGNGFRLVIRELQGELTQLETRLSNIAAKGVPNYFGPQRFGRGRQNLNAAVAMFNGTLPQRDRHLRGIYLSAARSEIFNRLLSTRVTLGNWDQAIPGDVYMFADSHSFFCDAITPEIETRIAELQIHPSGPLWGKGVSAASQDALTLEEAAGRDHHVLSQGLVDAGVEMDRRPLRLAVNDLTWQLEENASLVLTFGLPAGCYATSVLREFCKFDGELD